MSVMIGASFHLLRCGNVSRYHDAGLPFARSIGMIERHDSREERDLKIQPRDEVEGQRALVMVCDRGDDAVESLTVAARRFDLSGVSLASSTGPGATMPAG
jgi:hypothetical protein